MSAGHSKYVTSVLQAVQQEAVPSMMLVLFENQMAVARGTGCVLKIPVALAGRAEPTQWASICPAMTPVDEETRTHSISAAHTGFAFYDGADFYGTEREARDTRFAEPPITRPNPIYEGDDSPQAFVNREVFRTSTVLSGTPTTPATPTHTRPPTEITAQGDSGAPDGLRSAEHLPNQVHTASLLYRHAEVSDKEQIAGRETLEEFADSTLGI